MTVACSFLIAQFALIVVLALGVLRWLLYRALRSALTGARRAQEASPSPLSRWALCKAGAGRAWLWFVTIGGGIVVVFSMLNHVRGGIGATCAIAGLG